MHYLPDAQRTKQLSTQELRDGFLVQGLFRPGEIELRHIDLDRVVLGAAVPTKEPLTLQAPASLGSEYFTERREVGVLNIGGRGVVTVDGARYVMQSRDVLYIGRGGKEIVFFSDDSRAPARFYLVSYPAQASYPTKHVPAVSVTATDLGSAETANRRKLSRFIHMDAMPTAQLVMGVTKLEPGSVWNTMPAHTHHRRTEVYLYFDLADDAFVVHLMGEPTETRHLVVRNEEVVLSPPWSVHSGCGTANYSFCWAMGGENQVYTDMQPVAMRELK